MKPGHTDVTAPRAQHMPGACKSVSTVLSRVGDKWSVLVVMQLDEPRRFNELKRMIGGVSQRMLTLTLRGLERDGLVTRTVYPTVPPRVDYELTDLGRSLRDPIEALGQWVFTNLPAIEHARSKFDKKSAAGQAGGKLPAIAHLPPVARAGAAHRRVA